MAVTYADLVAFGFAYVEDNVSANFKKQKIFAKKAPIPLLSSEDMCVCKKEDFIIFAEFSEVKGPVALFTVPSYIQYDEKIDVNSFIMRIMSVDYQANPGGQFSICQDTQILQTHVSHGRHAYVHYFTLYDLRARGFVRPLCLAYVSSNHLKLHNIFPHLRDHFLKVTEMIKVNNRQHFRAEISSVLSALPEVPTNSDVEKISDEISTDTFNRNDGLQERQQREDLRYMMQVVESSLIDVDYTVAVIEHWQQALTFAEDSSISKEVQAYISLVSSTAYRKCVQHDETVGLLEKQLRPIPTLSPWGTACALSLLLNMLDSFGCCELSPVVGCFPSLSSLKSHSSGPLRAHDALSAWGSIGKTDFLQLLQAIALGALDASTPSLDEDDQVEGSSSKEGTSYNEGSSSYHSLSDTNSDALPKHSRGDSLSFSLSSPSDVYSEINNEIQERNGENGLVDSFHSLYVSGNSPQPENRDDFHSISDGSPILVNPSSDNNNTVEIFDSSHNIKKELSSSSSSSSSGSSNESESFHDILEALHSDDNWSVGSDDESLPLGAPWDHCIWTRHKPITKSGHRLLKFFWTYRSAAQHIIYSLLVGRTLVLTGDASSERRVQRVMSALSPLIPPLDRSGLRVLRWHQGILVSAHIASYQLIGMCIPERLSVHDMISPRDKNSVTILDVNTEQLLGPAYHGNLLAAIGNNVRDFPSDHSLLLYMGSVLNGVGQKLRAYKALVAACKNELPSHACRQLDLHGCDADMIRYLSKLTL